MFVKKDPYKILGVREGAPFSEVRAAYFRLARKHHPDKLVQASPEERTRHEEIFKEITAAYDAIERKETGQEHASGEGDWRSVWAKVESMFQRPEVWDCMQRVLVDAFASSAERRKQEKLLHTVYMPVTLEELHAGKPKKLQLFLQNVKDPVIVRASCTDYPCASIRTTIDGELHTIHAHMQVKEHEVYRFDDLLGKWDLYTDVALTWKDYLIGRSVHLPSLDRGMEGTIEVHVPAMPRMDVPLVVEGAGVAGKGDLYVSLCWAHPTRDRWDGLDENDKKDFMRVLDAFSA